jgi:uncharacterized protein
MKKLVAPPENWSCGMLISDVRKTGEPRRERYELALDGAVEYWGQDYTPTRPLTVEVTATYAGGDIVALVGVNGSFSVPCCRCLDETAIAISGEMRYIFSLRRSDENDEREPREDDGDGEPDGSVDVIVIEPHKAEIDMTPRVWEALILSLPERVLCREDCKGLCPVCGANLNATRCGCAEDTSDPRFAVLKNFLQ